MPSVSQRQNRFMHAVAEGDVAGVPRRVGREFVKADEGRKVGKLPETAEPERSKPDRRVAHMAKRAAAHGSVRKAAGEFGTSKSTPHRRIRQGYDRLGDA